MGGVGVGEGAGTSGHTSWSVTISAVPNQSSNQLPAYVSLADANGNIQLLMSLQQLLGEVAGEPWGYAWLPTPAIAAVGSLLHASLLRR